MLYEDGLIVLLNFGCLFLKDEQLKRFEARKRTPLKRWKFSPVDQKGQMLWDSYSHTIKKKCLAKLTQHTVRG